MNQAASTQPFVHLHNHTHYSMLDGLARPENYLEICKEQGMPACAITDHGGAYGLLDFYQKAQKSGIKPILGVEFYMARRTRHDKQPGLDGKPYHLVLLAKNNEGYKNLLQLTTKANLEGYYYKPRIDWELLEQHGSGLIGLSACLQGQIPVALLSSKENEAKETLQRFQSILGKENFFLELQHHPEIPEQAIANQKLIGLAKETGTPLVATNDCHYARADDAEAHDTLICIQTNAYLSEENRMRYTGDFSMRLPADMYETFKDTPEALTNTVKIAEACNVEIELHRTLLPKFPLPEDTQAKTEKAYLREIATQGFHARYGFSLTKKNPTPAEQEKISRLNYELEMVDKMGFNAYFLIVQDFVNYAKDKEILVGPGRGSAAGSILSYCLRITDIDPLEFGLIFERFLNPARISMPDIDIDFADDRRGEVIEYVREKYGYHNVAQIITFGTMAAKAAVKDVARVMEIPFTEANKLTDAIPAKPGIKLSNALQAEPDLQAYAKNPLYKKVFDTALKLEGTIRQVGVHACAVVISDKVLTEYTPLQHPPGNKGDDLISQYSAHPIEDIGLLKMDFLGLKNLTLLDKTIQIVKRTHNQEIKLAEIPEGNPEAYKLLQRGDTTGVFQLESAGMKRYLKELKPENLEDIIAMVSLYRPGPMEWIPDYIKGKHGEKKVKYLHPDLKEILELTYGVAVYQEQTMQIAQKFAGFSLADADILRKAIGKKIAELLTEQKEKFIQGAEKLGHPAKLAKQIFEKVIEPFAGYGFNKSHAASYAKIAYLTAYLKSHYPAEFMAALMTADQNDSDRIAIEFEECERMNIKVLPPDINESFRNFTVTDDGNIRFGLLAIKGVGDSIVGELVHEKDEHGTFQSLEDFLQRLPSKGINRKAIEALTLSGAMDQLGERKSLYENMENLLAYARDHKNTTNSNQQDIFDLLSAQDSQEAHALRLNPTPEATPLQKLKWEKEYLGMYITAHPLDGLKHHLSSRYKFSENIGHKQAGKEVQVGGIVTELRKMITKKGEAMLFAKLEDPTGELEVVLFPKIYAQYYSQFLPDQFVKVIGKVDYRRNERQIVVREAQHLQIDNIRARAIEKGVYDPEAKVTKGLPFEESDPPTKEKQDSAQTEPADKPAKQSNQKIKPYLIEIPKGTGRTTLVELNEILRSYPGETPVSIKIFSKNKWQEIHLPLKVKLDEQLKNQVRQIL